MENTVFNPIQLHLLRLFSVNTSEASLTELKNVLAKYYAEKLKNKVNDLWDNGTINLDKIEEIKHSHLRKHTNES